MNKTITGVDYEDGRCVGVLVSGITGEQAPVYFERARNGTQPTIHGFGGLKMTEYVEQITWHEVTYHALTDEEKAEYVERGYSDYEIPESFFDCKMPDDGEEILIATRWGVDKDVCCVDCDEVNDLIGLESNGDWDGVVAWAEMPKYKQED